MIGQELRHLQAVLDGKANALQHEFVAAGERVKALSAQIAEATTGDRGALVAEQQALREKQQTLAEDINVWRERARGVLRQPSDDALHAYLTTLLAIDDAPVHAAVAHVLTVLDTPEEELARQAQAQAQAEPNTPVGRLVVRARSEYDLRGTDPAPRRRAAFEFANRPGMGQNDEALAELEAALEAAGEKDPLVSEVLALTLVQVYRIRALNLADLDAAYDAVERLTHLKQRAAIPVLIEILGTPRTGFLREEGQMTAGDNRRAREAALNCLAEWRTAEAQEALRTRQRDRDPHISQAATRVLEQYPGEWT